VANIGCFLLLPLASTFELLQIADMVKIDVKEIELDFIRCELSYLKGKTLLAEKIESFSEFEVLKKMGFHLFQGFFFSKPQLISTKDIPPTQLSILKIASHISSKPGLDELSSIICP